MYMCKCKRVFQVQHDIEEMSIVMLYHSRVGVLYGRDSLTSHRSSSLILFHLSPTYCHSYEKTMKNMLPPFFLTSLANTIKQPSI